MLNALYIRMKKTKISEMKDDRVAPIRKEVDALTLKNRLGTRYNGNRLASTARYQPEKGKYKEVRDGKSRGALELRRRI
jgi:hypothetical protein